MEILPYLYLGCAKDSTNLAVLGQYNIKYILNVTPNLPNMFEHDGHFRYKQIPISDHWSQNLSQFFPEAISFIGECIGTMPLFYLLTLCVFLSVKNFVIDFLDLPLSLAFLKNKFFGKFVQFTMRQVEVEDVVKCGSLDFE